VASDKTSASWPDLFFRIGREAYARRQDGDLRAPDFPVTTVATVESALGFKLSGETHNAPIRHLLLTQGRLPYEPIVTFLTMVAGRLGGTYLDIGANIGYCSVLAASCSVAPLAVYAFEPSLPNFYWLRRNIAENRLGTAITPYLVGVGAEDGSAELSDYGTGSSFVRGWDHDIADAQGLDETSVRRLDSLVNDAVLATPTFAKIDVEGFELQVLRGAAKSLANPKVACVLCEIGHQLHPDGYNPDAAATVQTLESYGYHCFGLSLTEAPGAELPRMELTPAADADSSRDGVVSWPGLWLAIRFDDAGGFGNQLLDSLALFPLFLEFYPAPKDVLEAALADLAKPPVVDCGRPQ
jgi:FkbM family methyltransferase